MRRVRAPVRQGSSSGSRPSSACSSSVRSPPIVGVLTPAKTCGPPGEAANPCAMLRRCAGPGVTSTGRTKGSAACSERKAPARARISDQVRQPVTTVRPDAPTARPAGSCRTDRVFTMPLTLGSATDRGPGPVRRPVRAPSAGPA
ncbi:hypothetical protein PRAC110570_09550 [Propionibacterium acidifaciens]